MTFNYDLSKNRPGLLAWGKHITDADLVKMTASGENDAYVILLHRYHKLIYKVVRDVIWDEDDALDVMQESVIKIMQYIQAGKYNFGYRFATLVYQYCRWIALKKINKHYFISMSLDTVATNMASLKCFEQPEGERKLIESETKSELRKHINNLPKAQKQVIIMSEYFKMSYKEIAANRNINNPDTISAQRHDAIKRLRVSMGSKYLQPTVDRSALGIGPAPVSVAVNPKPEPTLSRRALVIKRLRELRLASQ